MSDVACRIVLKLLTRLLVHPLETGRMAGCTVTLPWVPKLHLSRMRRANHVQNVRTIAATTSVVNISNILQIHCRNSLKMPSNTGKTISKCPQTLQNQSQNALKHCKNSLKMPSNTAKTISKCPQTLQKQSQNALKHCKNNLKMPLNTAPTISKCPQHQSNNLKMSSTRNISQCFPF